MQDGHEEKLKGYQNSPKGGANKINTSKGEHSQLLNKIILFSSTSIGEGGLQKNHCQEGARCANYFLRVKHFSSCPSTLYLLSPPR